MRKGHGPRPVHPLAEPGDGGQCPQRVVVTPPSDPPSLQGVTRAAQGHQVLLGPHGRRLHEGVSRCTVRMEEKGLREGMSPFGTRTDRAAGSRAAGPTRTGWRGVMEEENNLPASCIGTLQRIYYFFHPNAPSRSIAVPPIFRLDRPLCWNLARGRRFVSRGRPDRFQWPSAAPPNPAPVMPGEALAWRLPGEHIIRWEKRRRSPGPFAFEWRTESKGPSEGGCRDSRACGPRSPGRRWPTQHHGPGYPAPWSSLAQHQDPEPAGSSGRCWPRSTLVVADRVRAAHWWPSRRDPKAHWQTSQTGSR